MGTGRARRTLDRLGLTDSNRDRVGMAAILHRVGLMVAVLVAAVVILELMSASGYDWFVIPFLGGVMLTATAKGGSGSR